MARFELRGTQDFCVEFDVKYDRQRGLFDGVILASYTGFSTRIPFAIAPSAFMQFYSTLCDAIQEAGFDLSESGSTQSEDAPQFGHVFDEPVEPVSGSTAETTRSIPMTPEASLQLAEKILHYFEAEDAAKGVAVGGSAIGDDDAALLEGEVA